MLKSKQEKSNLVPLCFTYSVFLLTVINVGTKLLTLCRQSWMRWGNKPMTSPVQSPEQHPGPRKVTFLHSWASADRQGICGSPFLVITVIGNHHLYCSHENWRSPFSCRGCHVIARFYLPPVCFPELFSERGGGQGTLGREEIITLSQGTVWRETHSLWLMWYSRCWMAAQPHSSKRARDLATSSLPWAAHSGRPSPCLKSRDLQWQGCAAAKPCCESLFVSVEEWPNPTMQ